MIGFTALNHLWIDIFQGVSQPFKVYFNKVIPNLEMDTRQPHSVPGIEFSDAHNHQGDGGEGFLQGSSQMRSR